MGWSDVDQARVVHAEQRLKEAQYVIHHLVDYIDSIQPLKDGGFTLPNGDFLPKGLS